MNKILPPVIFLLALFLSILTRFYQLGQAPHGLYLDEAAQGYNAYSILKTGKDEFGKSFPIVFRSFIDFKTPVYIYLITPLIPIFGLTKFTVRFPSFFFSILTFPILYLLIKKITPPKYATSLALTSLILLSVSPWHVLFGRTNFECNVALFFLLTATYCFYSGLKKPVLLLASSVLFAIAIPAYHSQRIITPLILIFLALSHSRTLLQKPLRRWVILSSFLGLLILFPTLSVLSSPGFLARASGLNIFSHSRQMPAGFNPALSGLAGLLANNSLFLSAKEFASLYLSYFSPRNMLILGDYGPRSSFPNLSTFFLWQAPFYFFGLYQFLKSKNLGQLKPFILFFFLISPLPAAVTRDPYSTIRALQMVIPQTVIISFGLLKFFELLTKPLTKALALSSLLILIVYSLAKLYSSAIILNEYYRGFYWDYGWEEVVEHLNSLDPNLPIIIDNTRFEPYIQILFFTKYDPARYQQDNFEVPLDQYYTNLTRNRTKIIGNITTRPINWNIDSATSQYLIGDSLSISSTQAQEHSLETVFSIFYPNGELAYTCRLTHPIK